MSSRAQLIGRVSREGVNIARNKQNRQYARFKVIVRRERRPESKADRHIVQVMDTRLINEIIAPFAQANTLLYVEGRLYYHQYVSRDGSNHRLAIIQVDENYGNLEILEGPEGDLI